MHDGGGAYIPGNLHRDVRGGYRVRARDCAVGGCAWACKQVWRGVSGRLPRAGRDSGVAMRVDYASHLVKLVLNDVRPIPPVCALITMYNARSTATCVAVACSTWVYRECVRRAHRAHQEPCQERSLNPARMDLLDVPGIMSDEFTVDVLAPCAGDSFFLATDATSKSDIAYVHAQGAVLLADLMQPADERLLGRPALFGDVLVQVEQKIAARAVFFYGHSMSFVASGVTRGGSWDLSYGFDGIVDWIFCYMYTVLSCIENPFILPQFCSGSRDSARSIFWHRSRFPDQR
ncbi:hypothetical protein PENSPDRAFT_495436 [Peniophora sp. CONT]|nr:hypothetical protein PENSPDRAFT_495436 [Peniophora sp. CONT]